ncbi:MAG: DUF4430 domain-containing protein, partial [Acutalibacteraceae bacterium]
SSVSDITVQLSSEQSTSVQTSDEQYSSAKSDSSDASETSSETQQSSLPSAVSSAVSSAPYVKSCTVSIECKTILSNMETIKPEKKSLVPTDGVILSPQKIALKDGDTVFDVLNRITKKNKIHMEFSATPGYNSKYIEGIGNIYEKDCGELSGWMFSVNGDFAQTGASSITVSDGDTISFVYTCDLGNDVGNKYDESK